MNIEQFEALLKTLRMISYALQSIGIVLVLMLLFKNMSS